MSYDPGREDEKLETRLTREMDRRFKDMQKSIDDLATLVDTNFKEIAANKRENYIWLLRMVITSIISIMVSGGAFYFLELLRGVHP